ncbi:hypothetical protein [Kosakonia oryzendophytica]
MLIICAIIAIQFYLY